MACAKGPLAPPPGITSMAPSGLGSKVPSTRPLRPRSLNDHSTEPPGPAQWADVPGGCQASFPGCSFLGPTPHGRKDCKSTHMRSSHRQAEFYRRPTGGQGSLWSQLCQLTA